MLAAFVALLTFAAMGDTARADTFTVQNLADDAPSSLRDAIVAANANGGPDDIEFSPSLEGTIQLASSLPTITEALDIQGRGRVAVDGGDQHQILSFEDTSGHFAAGVFALALRDGFTAGSGAAIHNSGAQLLIVDSDLTGNRAAQSGGAIFSDYRVEIGHSNLTGNAAAGNGGAVIAAGPDLGGTQPNLNFGNSQLNGNSAIGSGGGFQSLSGNVEIDGTTISSNDAGGGGGAIDHQGNNMFLGYTTLAFNHADGSGGAIRTSGEIGAGHQLTISDNSAGGSGGGVDAVGPFFFKQVTIANNSAAVAGGGIRNEQALDAGLTQRSLYNAIAADNSATVGADLSGIFDARYSLVENTGGAVMTSAVAGSNIFGLDPQLGPLTSNGASGETAPTLTRALAPASPAIDKASDAYYTTDQRGFPRGRDLAGVPNSTVHGPDEFDHPNASDIGAYELQPGSPPSISSLSPSHGSVAGGTAVTINGSGLGSATSVGFGATGASFTVQSASRITATSPAGSGVVDVVVSTPFGSSSASGAANDFTYDALPAQPPTPPVTTAGPAQTTEPSAGGGVPECRGREATIYPRGRRNRTLTGTSHRDVIVGGSGDDTVLSGGGNDIVCAGGGRDTVKGGDGSDRLYGEAGGDTLLGQLGDDHLYGDTGRDTCIGGPGRDGKHRC